MNGNSGEISGVTYNGVSMTIVTNFPADGGSGREISMFQLVAPATGANDIVVSFGISLSLVAVAGVSFTGVDQGTPLGTAVVNSGYSTTLSVTVGSATGELVVGAGASNNTITADGGQDDLVTGASGTNTVMNVGSKAGAASVELIWTRSAAGWWTTGGVPLKPAAAGAAGNPWYQYMQERLAAGM